MKLRNILAVGCAALGAFALASCGIEKKDDSALEHVTINALDGSKNKIELSVVKNPERVVILDFACLDVIDYIGEGDSVVGCATTEISYLTKYSPTSENGIINVGTIKEASMENIVLADPDIIFIGGRLSAQYDALNEIATTVYLATDTSLTLDTNTANIATEVAKIYGKEEQVSNATATYSSRINTINTFANDSRALVTMVSGTSINVLTNSGRCGIIGTICGFDNLANSTAADSTHGDTITYEYLLSTNPDYIFVMDRNAITGDSTSSAKDLVENDVVKQTSAYKNGHIVYLENSNVWYTAEGGIQALGVMLSDLEKGLGLN